MVNTKNVTLERIGEGASEKKFLTYLEEMFDRFDVSYAEGRYIAIGNDWLENDKIIFSFLRDTFTVKDPKYESIGNRLAGIYEKYFNLERGREVQLEFDYS